LGQRLVLRRLLLYLWLLLLTDTTRPTSNCSCYCSDVANTRQILVHGRLGQKRSWWRLHSLQPRAIAPIRKPRHPRMLHAIHPTKEGMAMVCFPHTQLQLQQVFIQQIAHAAIDGEALECGHILPERERAQAFRHVLRSHLV